MTSVLFLEWLTELDTQMKEARRKIALVMDNAPGHGDIQGMDNVDIIRLPANTTSISQPLDAGIVRSFKAKYSRHMVRVISQHRQQAETDDIKVPNAEVYSMKGELRTEVVQQNDDELEAIKQEIMELYPDRADAIALQKDYGASVYFQSLQDKGPSPNYLKALELVRNHPEYKDFFIAKKNQASDGDEEEDENDEDSKDSDHTPEETQHNRATSPRLLRTRQRTYSMDPPEL